MGHHHRKVREDITLQTNDCVVLSALAADSDVARIRRKVSTKVAGHALPSPVTGTGGNVRATGPNARFYNARDQMSLSL
eukprot:3005453-Heterocapsa_arctica.AAC.1